MIDTLRAYVAGSKMSKKDFTVLQRAYNEPVELISSTNRTNPPKLPRLFMVKPSFENQARGAELAAATLDAIRNRPRET